MSGSSAQLLGALVWGARAWLLPAVAITTIALAVLAWGYLRLGGSRRLRFTAATLKAVGIALLAAILLDPLWSGTRARPGENILLILADNSRSMQVRGDSGTKTVGDAFAEQLGGTLGDERLPWLVRLKQDFDVRRYAFGDRLEPRTSFADFKFDGRSSSLHTALRALATRFEGRPLAGIVLLSDGSATDVLSPADLAKLPPIYTVLPPETAPAAEVSVTQVAATQTGFEDAPVTLTAEAQLRGFAGEPLVCQVIDEAGKVVQTQEQTPGERDGTAAFRFQFRPAKPGLSFYRVRATAKSQLGVWEKPEMSREGTLANNERMVQVDRGRGPYRVLYVGGAPNPEHKFLGRSLADDKQVELTSLVRIARREPKFDFRTRAGETSNPLFRGFDKTDDETERYDQPVFVRLGIREENELRDGFPKSADQLFAYHAVVLDDVEAELFTTDQMALLARFVSERGGGLLMLGGPDGFSKGRFEKTPVADILPVYMQRSAATMPRPEAGYCWKPTREGWLEPWLRLRANEADERLRLETMPPFRTLNRTSGIKPGAVVLAAAVDSSGAEQPALVVQNYGRGRAAALLIGDMWRWRLKMEPENQDLEKTWRQLVRWLTADVPGRITASSEVVADELTQSVRIAVRARDPDYRPLDNAQVKLRIVSPDGTTLPLDMEPSRREAGIYEASYVPRAPGAYRASVSVVDGSGKEIGGSETGWTNDPSADEFRRLEPDRDLLRKIATETKGDTVELKDLERFASELAARPVPETVQSLFPIWHTAWVFGLAIACLAGEWGLRRWRGLP
ncbi:MAG: glutamine amidotransferase [Planctomycetia bacterium]|nr:glutamine amidotransferase [Planctomycetia bacterium]